MNFRESNALDRYITGNYGEDQIQEDECNSCNGYGHFASNGEPSIDRRNRKCLDCRGTGRVFDKNLKHDD